MDVQAISEKNSLRVPFAPRLGAWAIDLATRLVLGGVFGALVGAAILAPIYQAQVAQEVNSTLADASGLWKLLGGMVGILFGILVFHILIGIMEGFTGLTPGKLALKFKDAHQDGHKAPMGQLLLRALIKYSPSLFTLTALLTRLTIFQTLGFVVGLSVLIGYFLVLGNKRQGLHDLISKTSVFKKDQIQMISSIN